MSSELHDRARKHWTVAIEIDERDGHTRANARLRWRDQTAVGIGMARIDPDDRNIADIGDELAAARALGRPRQADDGRHDPRHRSGHQRSGDIAALRRERALWTQALRTLDS
jgi:uncharacterized protein DUF1876